MSTIENQTFSISLKFSLGGFIKASFVASFYKVYMLIVGVAALVGVIFFYPIFFVRFWGLMIFVFMPVWVLIVAFRNFKTNPVLQEEQTVTFSEKGVVVQGKTFSMEREWTSIHRVATIQSFLFVWMTRRTAYPLPRASFNEEQLAMLNHWVNGYDNVKNGLKVTTEQKD